MTTWAEIQAHVRTRYELETDTPTSFSLWFNYENGERQRVEVRRFLAFGIDWLEFRSLVGPETAIAPEEALARNANMACGALALDGDCYFMLYTAPLPTMDTEELELPLYVVAGHSMTLQAELTHREE